MQSRIDHLNDQARKRLGDLAAADTYADIAEAARQPGREAPLISEGIRYSGEGIETPMSAGEAIPLKAELPAREVSWAFRPGRYRVEIEVQRPTTLSAYSGETRIFEGRRVHGTAVLDFTWGRVRLKAAAPITSVRLSRFERRAEGRLVLGPFPAEGAVSAKVIGHGSWAAMVATDDVIGGTWAPPAFTPDGTRWSGPAPGGARPAEAGLEGLPWSQARRVVDVRPPTFAERVMAGTWRYGRSEITYEGDAAEHEVIWGPLGRWQPLGPTSAPGFDADTAQWTCLYGTATGVDRAYDLETGRPADASVTGAYLIKARDPGQVEVDGVVCAQGHPRTGYLPKGRYVAAKKAQAPGYVVVEIEGKGLARQLELRMERQIGPAGITVTRTRRIDLASLWDPAELNVPPAPDASAKGLFMPASLTA